MHTLQASTTAVALTNADLHVGIAVLQFIHFILLKRWAYNEKHAASQQVASEKKSQ
jgi:hypothetical protein